MNLDKLSKINNIPMWPIGGLALSVFVFTLSGGSISTGIIGLGVGLIFGILFTSSKFKMIWNLWPYWLRGGMIGGGIILLSYGFYFSCLHSTLIVNPQSWGLQCFIIAFPILLPFFISIFSPFVSSLPYSFLYIIWVIIFIILGAIVGGIIGFIKNKKSPLP